MESMIEPLLSICLGLGLAAACGFRVFVPFLVMSLASRAGEMNLSEGFAWIDSDAALIAFGAATVLEIGAYFIPWVDNLLDSIATPAAVVAGIVATAAAVGDTSPLVGWGTAVIGGGTVAGVVQGASTVIRGASSVMTAGFGNPLVAGAEAVGAVGLAALAIVLPLVAALLVATLFIAASSRMVRASVATRQKQRALDNPVS